MVIDFILEDFEVIKLILRMLKYISGTQFVIFVNYAQKESDYKSHHVAFKFCFCMISHANSFILEKCQLLIHPYYRMA